MTLANILTWPETKLWRKDCHVKISSAIRKSWDLSCLEPLWDIRWSLPLLGRNYLSQPIHYNIFKRLNYKWQEYTQTHSISFLHGGLATCRSLGAWTLAIPDLALRGILLITWLGPGQSTSMSTRALYSSAGPSSPDKQPRRNCVCCIFLGFGWWKCLLKSGKVNFQFSKSGNCNLMPL